MTKGHKVSDSEGKPRLSSVPMGPLLQVAKAFQYGDGKYDAPLCWRSRDIDASDYFDAAARHLVAWWSRDDRDPESGLPHLAHAIASIMIIMDAREQGSMHDNRPHGAITGQSELPGPGPQ